MFCYPREQNTRDNHKVGPHEGDEQGGTTLSTSPLEKVEAFRVASPIKEQKFTWK